MKKGSSGQALFLLQPPLGAQAFSPHSSSAVPRQPELFSYIDDDKTILEREPLENLSKEKQLMAFKHNGFWQCMDTQRDKDLLEELWQKKNPPWVI